MHNGHTEADDAPFISGALKKCGQGLFAAYMQAFLQEEIAAGVTCEGKLRQEKDVRFFLLCTSKKFRNPFPVGFGISDLHVDEDEAARYPHKAEFAVHCLSPALDFRRKVFAHLVEQIHLGLVVGRAHDELVQVGIVEALLFLPDFLSKLPVHIVADFL